MRTLVFLPTTTKTNRVHRIIDQSDGIVRLSLLIDRMDTLERISSEYTHAHFLFSSLQQIRITLSLDPLLLPLLLPLLVLLSVT